MTDTQMEGFARATELLTDALAEPWWWKPKLMKPSPLPWPGGVGIRIGGGAAHATDEVVGWFRARGWIAAAFRDDLIAAPLVAAEVPDSCFHVTPASNRDGILARGLMRGAEAGVSTTGRADAACRIHVSFDPDAATRWAEEHLAPHNPSGLWVLFRVSRAGIAGPVYRDPASHTGYIIEGGRVAPEALRVEREWAVAAASSPAISE